MWLRSRSRFLKACGSVLRNHQEDQMKTYSNQFPREMVRFQRSNLKSLTKVPADAGTSTACISFNRHLAWAVFPFSIPFGTYYCGLVLLVGWEGFPKLQYSNRHPKAACSAWYPRTFFPFSWHLILTSRTASIPWLFVSNGFLGGSDWKPFER